MKSKEYWPIKNLKRHPLNHTVYGDDDLDEDFIESVKKHGVLIPITIKHDGTIISGHRRLAAALKAKLDAVPVDKMEFQDALDEEETLIVCNKTREKTNAVKAREARELKRIEAERARQKSLSNLKNVSTPIDSDKLSQSIGRTDQIVGEKLGVSSKTVERMVKAIETADKCFEDGNDKMGEKILKALNKSPSAGYNEAVKVDPPATKKKAEEQHDDRHCQECKHFGLNTFGDEVCTRHYHDITMDNISTCPDFELDPDVYDDDEKPTAQPVPILQRRPWLRHAEVPFQVDEVALVTHLPPDLLDAIAAAHAAGRLPHQNAAETPQPEKDAAPCETC